MELILTTTTSIFVCMCVWCHLHQELLDIICCFTAIAYLHFTLCREHTVPCVPCPSVFLFHVALWQIITTWWLHATHIHSLIILNIRIHVSVPLPPVCSLDHSNIGGPPPTRCDSGHQTNHSPASSFPQSAQCDSAWYLAYQWIGSPVTIQSHELTDVFSMTIKAFPASACRCGLWKWRGT